ncbi:MAG: M16 family metallopeptidase [Hyphomicrobiales bacterium]
MDRKKGVTPKAITDIKLSSPKKLELDNGIPLYITSGGSQEMSKIEIVFEAGSYYQELSGTSYLLGRMMKVGTKSYTSEDIDNIVDGHGALFSAIPEKDSLIVSLTTLNKHLPALMPVLAEVICSCTFPQSEYDQLVNDSIHDLTIDRQKVKNRGFLEFQNYIYGLNSSYRSISNREEYDLLNRDIVVDFYHHHIIPSKCKIFVCGLPDDNIKDVLNKYLGHQWRENIIIEPSKACAIPVKPDRYYIDIPDAMQSAIIMGSEVPNKNDKYYHEMDVLNTVLGGYFGSRLMANIREDKGYTYGVHSHIVTLKHFSYLYVSTDIAKGYTDLVFDEIYKEFKKLREELISDEELDKVRSNMLGSLLGSIDGSISQGERWRTSISNGVYPEFFEDNIHIINTVKASTLRELANKYLREDQFIEVVTGHEENK